MGSDGTILGLSIRGMTLVAVVSAWIGGILLVDSLKPPSLAAPIGIIIACILIVLLWQDKQGRFIMILLLCVCLGAARYMQVSPDYDPQAIKKFISSDVIRIRGTVSDEPKLVGCKGTTRELIITASSISQDNGAFWQDAHGSLEVLTLGTTIDDPYGANYGDGVELSGKLQSPTMSSPCGNLQSSTTSPPGIFATMAFPRVTVRRSEENLFSN